MATPFQHLYAFFSPNVAVNEDGYMVKANGLFDSGDSSTDYIPPDYTAIQQNGFLDWSLDHPMDGFYSPSDTYFADSRDNNDWQRPEYSQIESMPFGTDLINMITDLAKMQNEAAQSSADRAMEFEKEQADNYNRLMEDYFQRSMDYNTEMSNTAYQRAMADMKAAGLNPKLAAQLGGASTPTVSAPSAAAGSGHIASMAIGNVSAISQLLSTYITSAASLSKNNNDFVQNSIGDLLGSILSLYSFSKGFNVQPGVPLLT